MLRRGIFGNFHISPSQMMSYAERFPRIIDKYQRVGSVDPARRNYEASGYDARAARNHYTQGVWEVRNGGLQRDIDNGFAPPPYPGVVGPPSRYAYAQPEQPGWFARNFLGAGQPAPAPGYAYAPPPGYGAPPQDPALTAYAQLSAGDQTQIISNMRVRHGIQLSPSSDGRVATAELSAALRRYAGNVGLEPNHPDPRAWADMLQGAARQGREAGVGRPPAPEGAMQGARVPHPAPVHSEPLPPATPAPGTGTTAPGAGTATPGTEGRAPLQGVRPMRGQRSEATPPTSTAIPVTEEARALQTAIVAYGQASGRNYTHILATSATPNGIDGQKGQKTEQALADVRSRLGQRAHGLDDGQMTALLTHETAQLASRAPHSEPTSPADRNTALRRGVENGAAYAAARHAPALSPSAAAPNTEPAPTASRPPLAGEPEPASLTAAAVLAPFGAIASTVSEGASAIYTALPAPVREMARIAAGEIALSVRSVESPSRPGGAAASQEAAITPTR